MVELKCFERMTNKQKYHIHSCSTCTIEVVKNQKPKPHNNAKIPMLQAEFTNLRVVD